MIKGPSFPLSLLIHNRYKTNLNSLTKTLLYSYKVTIVYRWAYHSGCLNNPERPQTAGLGETRRAQNVNAADFDAADTAN